MQGYVKNYCDTVKGVGERQHCTVGLALCCDSTWDEQSLGVQDPFRALPLGQGAVLGCYDGGATANVQL